MVITVDVEGYSGPISIGVDGIVVPFRELTLAAEVDGHVTLKSKNCRAGRTVRKGDLLFEIDASDYQLEVDRLTQEMKQAEINLEEIGVEEQNVRDLIDLASTDFKLQSLEVTRLRRLVAGGGVTRSDLERAMRTQIASRNSRQTYENLLKLLDTSTKTTTGVHQTGCHQTRASQSRPETDEVSGSD